MECERAEEIPVFAAIARAPMATAKPPLFADVPDGVLLGYGVPPEWLADVRRVNEDTVLDLADHLPPEAAEALLSLATGSTPAMPVVAPGVPVGAGPTAAAPGPDADPFAHPDAQRRFRVMTNVEELERALDYPWEKWLSFCIPPSSQLVDRDYSGPARVVGFGGHG